VAPGARYVLAIPAPEPIAPQPEAIPLTVAHEDDDLIVIDKPAGMTVHPAPGAPRGTLVNALLAHCGDSLSGVGGALRPGVVHRIDKDTSGLLVVAKTDAAHQGLARQFAAHDIERLYIAFTRGAPDRADPRLSGLPAVSFAPPPWDAEGPAWGRIDAPLARHPGDRKRMAVAAGGRRAVTWFRVLARYPAGAKSGARSGVSAARAGMIACRLETGRTHQIRVHLRHVGHALLGDPVYGVGGPAPAATPPRQALHAATLGFTHPRTGAAMRFESAPPEDLRALEAALAAL
ncbi:MAG: RluA family pseudouridine synthase, partial [Pseudomonadota bacterium]